jgi:hypothetical protein
MEVVVGLVNALSTLKTFINAQGTHCTMLGEHCTMRCRNG